MELVKLNFSSLLRPAVDCDNCKYTVYSFASDVVVDDYHTLFRNLVIFLSSLT